MKRKLYRNHKGNIFGHGFQFALVEQSPLRRVDPRIKLLLGVVISLAVMLPLERLLIFWVVYLVFLTGQKLLPSAARLIWRLKWLLLVLFILDYLLISLELAVVVTLRLALMSGIFTLLTATTTPDEMVLALEGLRFPYRYAFSLGLAFQSLSLLEQEWRAIQEAQRSRGVHLQISGLRQAARQARDLVAFTVPVIVLTTRRAWSITEAAYARGFDAPHRSPYRRLKLTIVDGMYGGLAMLAAVFIFWR